MPLHTKTKIYRTYGKRRSCRAGNVDDWSPSSDEDEQASRIPCDPLPAHDRPSRRCDPDISESERLPTYTKERTDKSRPIHPAHTYRQPLGPVSQARWTAASRAPDEQQAWSEDEGPDDSQGQHRENFLVRSLRQKQAVGNRRDDPQSAARHKTTSPRQQSQTRVTTRSVSVPREDEEQDESAGYISPEQSAAVEGLADDFAALSLRRDEVSPEPAAAQPYGSSAVNTLLRVCSQNRPLDFDDLLKSPRQWIPNKQESLAATDVSGVWTKAGEATYSEVFAWQPTPLSTRTRSASQRTGDKLVFKVIPLTSPTSPPREYCGYESEPLAVAREVQIATTMGKQHRNFASFLRAFVVTGSYPISLQSAWIRWREEHASHAHNPLPSPGLFAVLVMRDGGSDLESIQIGSWFEAASILWQATEALALGETLGFEHRDLHWGNILVYRAEWTSADVGQPMNLYPWSDSNDVSISIIDFTLSRCDCDGVPVVAPPPADIFRQSGEPHFAIYDLMRAEVLRGTSHKDAADPWFRFHPKTNVLWLGYLARILLHHKNLVPPAMAPVQQSSTVSDGDETTAALRVSMGSHHRLCEQACFDWLMKSQKCFSVSGSAGRALKALETANHGLQSSVKP